MQHSTRLTFLASALVSAGFSPALAQNYVGDVEPVQKRVNVTNETSTSGNEGLNKNSTNSFQEFRNRIKDEFNDFRKQAVENYATFLEGEWVKFEPVKSADRYSTPKPKSLPIAENGHDAGDVKRSTALENLHSALVAEGEMPAATVNESKKEKLGLMSDELLKKFTKSKEIRRIISQAKYRHTRPDDNTPGDWFTFYDMDLHIPTYDYSIIEDMRPYADSETYSALRNDAAEQWRQLEADHVGEVVSRELSMLASDMNLNDYLTYELTRCYVNEKFPKASTMARTALVHYLLVHMGYDARLGSSEGLAFLILPSMQELYATYGMPYSTDYMFSVDNESFANKRFYGTTFANDMPKDMPHGKKFDFRINNLKLPYVPVKFDIACNGINLKGEVNAMVMPIVRKYPQMPTESFAESMIDPSLHESLIAQVKEQLGGMPIEEAANKLLWFTQRGFDYATDDELHGYEKPYFLEENFFYPANDCEDRSIFYSYLMWNALGIEAQLLAYPGHESVGVRIPSLISDRSYVYNYMKQPFIIADPTYIDASIGDAMKFYMNIPPEKVDLYYNPVYDEQRREEIAAAEEEKEKQINSFRKQ